jgi:hypothetical protein
MKRLIIAISSFAVFGLDIAAQTKAPPAPGEPPKQEEEAPPAMTVPPGYRFQVGARRDPFVNPVPKPVEEKPAAAVAQDRPKGPRGVALSEAQVAAIVVSQQAPELTRVLIRTTAGRTYSLRKGDSIFDAVVKDIRKDAVVFELTSKDKSPNAPREVVRKVSP